MDSTTATVIVVVLFALIIVAVILRYRQNISLKIKTLLGSLAVDASDKEPTPPSDRSRFKSGHIKSGRDTTVHTQRGSTDIETGNIESGRDTTYRDEVVPPSPDPKADPPA